MNLSISPWPIAVDRRIGGLEMLALRTELAAGVDRRIGGLERLDPPFLKLHFVDRRIGGLEKDHVRER